MLVKGRGRKEYAVKGRLQVGTEVRLQRTHRRGLGTGLLAGLKAHSSKQSQAAG